MNKRLRFELLVYPEGFSLQQQVLKGKYEFQLRVLLGIF